MNIPVLVIAAVGGLTINLLNLLEAANLPKDRRPNFKDPLYWASFPIGAALGAFVAYVYLASDFDMKPILALHVGASSPLVLRAAASAIPKGIKVEPTA